MGVSVVGARVIGDWGVDVNPRVRLLANEYCPSRGKGRDTVAMARYNAIYDNRLFVR